MPWNFSASTWSKPFAGATVALGEEWTVTGLEFYQAMLTTEVDPIQSILWEIRTTVDDLGAAGEFAVGAVTGYTIEDTGLNMTGVYSYDIHKISITFDAPVVLTGGRTTISPLSYIAAASRETCKPRSYFPMGLGQ